MQGTTANNHIRDQQSEELAWPIQLNAAVAVDVVLFTVREADDDCVVSVGRATRSG